MKATEWKTRTLLNALATAAGWPEAICVLAACAIKLPTPKATGKSTWITGSSES